MTALTPDQTDEIRRLITTATDRHDTLIRQLQGAGANAGAYIGQVTMHALAAAPALWLACDGTAFSRTVYAALFAAVGTVYGVGDGSTTFNVPDLKGRVAVGPGTGTAAGATAHALGDKPTTGPGGEEKHTLTIAEIPAHTHDLGVAAVAAGSVGVFNSGAISTTGSTGGGLGHNIMQPFTVLAFAIYAGA